VTPYFLDTSALVKRYVTSETGSAWVQSLFDPMLANVVFVAGISPVELCSALSKKVRMGEIGTADRDAMMTAFWASAADYVFVDVDPVMPRAEVLAKRYGLRAYDAVQLAAAMQAKQRLDPALAPGLVLVAADAAPLAAAAAEGLLRDDPNQH
jgi:hypothetical protein